MWLQPYGLIWHQRAHVKFLMILPQDFSDASGPGYQRVPPLLPGQKFKTSITFATGVRFRPTNYQNEAIHDKYISSISDIAPNNMKHYPATTRRLGHGRGFLHVISGDNVLLAQELMRGYHRQRGSRRCAFKIDIQKAYDTVNWCFLEEILKRFGFHPCMISWLMKCISSASFTVRVNGEHHDFFPAKRGDALMEFSASSGLKPSMMKSTSFLGNVVGVNREEILKILPFKLGTLPVRYLGVPLISTKLFHNDCLGLIDKVKRRIMDWKNKWLSFAGRLQLINSVLSSISVYWSSMFLLPASVVKEIEKLLRNFLWSSGEAIRGKAKVAWKVVCLPRSKVFDAPWFWRKIVRIRDDFRSNLVHSIGDGTSTFLWFDNWHPLGPLCHFISKRDLYEAKVDVTMKVRDVVCDGFWLWPVDLWNKFSNIFKLFQPVLRENVRDKVLWRSQSGSIDDFSVAAVWDENFLNFEEKSWHKLIWFSQGVPRHAFILWLAINERLRTLDRLLKWKVKEEGVCVLCNVGMENHSHIFVECAYAREVWNCLEGVSGIYFLISSMEGDGNSWSTLIEKLSGVKVGNSIWSIIHRLVLAAGVYFIWQERNKRLHGEASRSAVVLARQIFQLIQMKLMGLKVKDGDQVRRAAMIWDLEVQNGGLCAKV
ncbi:hypothetical protein OSB04_un001487 [Centaurea solstitialis]|uniref:Reverse transcriptase zinc-binding domain-containing protein n=1 Tax=Centaurea solstitialis TaxID=347529 RepID=A0AA38VUL9_9ASTR|nr:hypothetical protein OSB04_un001487 [Centaurea solstitialis]